jgi:predicted nuclease with RNAse H fold
VRTLGIDLAADPVRTAACEVDWETGTLRPLPRPVTDEAIVAAVLAADVTAIDVPLGWPDDFVAAVSSHHGFGDWPPAAIASPDDRLSLRYRVTDLELAGHRPLSVSSDLIGVPAMRGARLQHLLRRAGAVVDRSGIGGCLVEGYPAAALRSWGLTSRGYKGRKNRGSCGELAGILAAACGSLASAVAGCLDGCDDDELDAVVCALIARAARQGQTRAPAPDQLDAARREGWIHVPVVPVAAVLAQPS